MHAKGIQKTAQRIDPGGLTHEGYIPSCARSFLLAAAKQADPVAVGPG